MSSTYRQLNKLYVLTIALLLSMILPEGRRNEILAAPPKAISICIGGAPGIPFELAQAQGLFAQEGLTVTLKRYVVGQLAFEGLLAGECDLATVGETPLVMKSFQRHDFRILATFASSDDSPRIVANKKKGIHRPEDLKGKRIFVHKGSVNHFFTDLFLLENGLSTQKVALTFEDVGDISTAMTSGRIDAVAGSDVVIAPPRKTLGEDAVVFSSPGLCLITFNLVSLDNVIRKRPLVVTAVLNALLKTAEVLTKDRPRALPLLARAMNRNEQEMTAVLSSYDWSVVLAQTLLLSLEQEAQWAMAAGLIDKTRIPNFLDFIHRDALFSLRPEAVTMLK